MNLNQAIRQVNSGLAGLGRSLKQTSASMGGLQRQSNSAATPLSKIKNTSGQTATALGLLRSSANGGGSAVRSLQTGLRTDDASLGKSKTSTDKFKTSQDHLKSSSDKANTALRDVKRQSDAVEKSVGKASKSASGGGKSMGGLGKGLKGATLAQKGLTVDELHLTARVPKKIGPPEWVALTQGGCGDVKDRVFDLDLDKPKLVDRGVVGSGEADPSEPPVRTNPLGSGFTVSSTDPAIVRVDVSACRGNYEWSLQIDYSYHGKTLHKVVGPFKSLSLFQAGSSDRELDSPAQRRSSW
ncbi:hypothetical protein [Streptomyces sp. NPDC059753]|uniref:hypothetical protein n=1 Tax=Streptomyces sp. NPDC059753 TaxID=3346933 RepID=UPI0036591222